MLDNLARNPLFGVLAIVFGFAVYFGMIRLRQRRVGFDDPYDMPEDDTESPASTWQAAPTTRPRIADLLQASDVTRKPLSIIEQLGSIQAPTPFAPVHPAAVAQRPQAPTITLGRDARTGQAVRAEWHHGVIVAPTQYGKNDRFFDVLSQLQAQGATVYYATGKFEASSRDGMVDYMPIYARCAKVAYEPSGAEALQLLRDTADLVITRIQESIDAAEGGRPEPIFPPVFLFLDEAKVFMEDAWAKLSKNAVHDAAQAIGSIVARGHSKNVFYWTTTQDFAVSSVVVKRGTMGNFGTRLLSVGQDDASYLNAKMPQDKRPAPDGRPRSWYAGVGNDVSLIHVDRLTQSELNRRHALVAPIPAQARTVVVQASNQLPATPSNPAGGLPGALSPAPAPVAPQAAPAPTGTRWTNEQIKAATFIYQYELSKEKLSNRKLSMLLWQKARPSKGTGAWGMDAGALRVEVAPLVAAMRSAVDDLGSGSEEEQEAEELIGAN